MERQRRSQLATMRKILFDQGYLDDQFIQLEELQDDANPNFVEEIVTSFFRESFRIMQNIERTLEENPPDFSKLETHIQQLRGSCSSIGARKVTMECTQFRDDCRAGDMRRCKRSFPQLKREYTTLKGRLEAYFRFARQAGPVETAGRPK